MKPHMQSTCLTRASFAVALALSLGLPQPAHTDETGDGEIKGDDAKMMERCQQMKEHKQKMTAEIKAQDKELSEQAARLNRAPETARVELLTALVTRLVEQRSSMDADQARMDEEMMRHMMQHMQMGKESMLQCPMMKGMKGMKDAEK